MEHLSLSILGANSAIPLSNRSPTAQFLSIADEHFLIDCGEGTQVKLRQHRIGFGRINHILISHLHGDHFYGLIPLLTSLQLLDRRQSLHIYGPANLEVIIRTFLEQSAAKIQYPLEFHALDPERKSTFYESKSLKISSFPLKHSLPCFGFLFEETERPRKMRKDVLDELSIPVAEIRKIKGGADWHSKEGKHYSNSYLTEAAPQAFSYAYCTDTLPIKHLHRYFKSVDLLYHEATFMAKDQERAKQTTHSTTLQAAEIANLVDARYLLIGHFSARYRSFEQLVNESRQIFKKTYEAKEGYRFSLERDRLALKAEKERSY